MVNLNKVETRMCAHAVDQFIKRMEFFNQEIKDEWYKLREKLKEGSK